MIIIGLLISIFIKIQKNLLDKHKNSGFVIQSIPVFGYRTHGIMKFKNVKWRTIVPKKYSWHDTKNTDPDLLEISKIPYCPNCENMELNENKNVFGRYVWKCIKCGFKTTNKFSASEESENALKLARSAISE